ncbi:Stk1 family PASTA domain-containing Ser/Thr kinase [Agromyces archimandritae]|uniref:non-specific serine/threonine protein kinase n=1 Tax=Agromyces archimandritae TaxID=2781962 RepID=A0A975FRR7_9MICO|nr:Stk1 family PASTA domain-containing Ser/Thr kinase [Agromyces archimandritae]QTX06031.1 Stk1 family PASTA domain-containing Ser/Thr kinase [Agromyces archimandritae]
MSDEGRLIAGRYRVGALIGRGGMSDVHAGDDLRLGRRVAIKLLKPQLATDPAFRMRFRQEAQSAARMAHPTIVRVFDAGEETVTDSAGQEVQLPFIVMEFVEGRLLKDIIADGPVEPQAAVRIIDGVLTALEYSHRAGVVHRDIKPGNIMITTAGQVKVMDFGIARAVSDSATTVAQTTAILGTASYFSPEQAKGETVDARTDLYSTGVVLFELLTGRPPFRGDTPVAVAYQHVSEQPIKPSQVNPRVSPALDVVVLRALSKDRNARYQSAAEFREDVDEAAAGRVPVNRHTADETAMLFGAPASQLTSSELALRQLAEDETMHRTQRRPPATWIWAGIIAVVVVVVAVMFWAVNLVPTNDIPSNAREVPQLAGKVYDDAKAELEELGLTVTRVDEVDEKVEAGLVSRTLPEAGEIVGLETNVRVMVSTGPQPVEVPDLRNKNLEDAKLQLSEAGLKAGAERRENSPTVAADIVLGTSPEQGQTLEAGSAVDLVLSSGNVTLPDLTGQPVSDASAVLQAANLQLNAIPTADPSCKEADGNPVLHQSLAPGDVPQHSDVELRYCTGKR